MEINDPKKVTSYSSIETLLPALDEFAREAELVSFDIFDTLFLRRTEDPDQVKYPVGAHIAAQAQQLGITLTVDEALESRNQIEDAHREANRQPCGDQECNYLSFMEESLKQLFGSAYHPSILEKVTDYEMEVESATIVVRTGLASWISKAAAAGLKIILISDMYLPSDLLWRLVRAKGLSSAISDVVSSADSLVTKASGQLYRKVGANHNVSPGNWVHVGDNIVSDGIRADEFGIHALNINESLESERKSKLVKLRHAAESEPSAISRYAKGLMEPLAEERRLDGGLYDLGRADLGNILGYFTLRLTERCSELGIDHVYFCAREGYSFQAYWDTFHTVFPDPGHAPTSSYLQVSRLALARASAGNGLSPLSLRGCLLPEANRSFKHVCRVFGLDSDTLTGDLKSVGLSLDCDLKKSENIGKAHELLRSEEFQAKVRAQGQASLSNLKQYLGENGFFEHGRVALVDIGWLGTIPHLLESCLEHCSGIPDIHAMYLGATRGMPYENHERVEGLIYDRRQHNYREGLIANFKDLLEEALRAPHPSVVDYRMDVGTAAPLLRHYDDEVSRSEQRQNENYKSLHEGYIDSAVRFASMVSLTGYTSKELAPWMRESVYRLFALPQNHKLEQLRPEAHENDFGGSLPETEFSLDGDALAAATPRLLY